MNNEIKTAGSNLTEIAEYTETAAALADLRQRHAGVVFDVTVSKEMKLAKEARAEIRGLRTGLEKKRVEIKAPALERCRLIDAEAKRITAELLALEEPIDVQIKAEEARAEAERLEKLEAERLRVEAIQQKIQAIRDVPGALVGKPAVIIAGKLACLRETVLDAVELGEYRIAADDALMAAIARTAELLDAQKGAEAEHARVKAEREELEHMRAENARLQQEAEARAEANRLERERLAQVERDRVAADERAQREAEQAKRNEEARIAREAQEEADRIERERIAAERAEEQAALAAERERQAAEQRQLDEQAAKLKREQQEAAAAAEKARLAGLGLHEAVRAVLAHFEPMMDNDSEPQCIKDLRVAFLNYATKAKPARAKKAAAA